MLSSLLELIDSGEFEDDGSVRIEAATKLQDDLLVRLHVTLPDGNDVTRSIRCHKPRVHELIVADEFNCLSICDDHVVLWPHTQQITALYFNGCAQDKRCLLGALIETHYRVVGDWFPFTRFLNSVVFSPYVDLLASQSGLLAEGPDQLMIAYRAVLDDFGIRCSSPPARESSWWDGTRWCPNDEKLYALIFGRSYVVAPSFSESVP